MGIIGPNGAGKTTLFRMLVGQEAPDAGTITIGTTVQLSYVDQGRDSLQADKTVFEEITQGTEVIKVGSRELPARAYVSSFNFRGTDQQKLVGALSGGERNRVHLAKLLQSGGNVLLLDEPTNDLDVDTLRALEAGLESFPGCVVVISHDRWFLDRIATHILAFEGDSQVRWFTGQPERLRGVPSQGAGHGRRPAAPHQVQAHQARLTAARWDRNVPVMPLQGEVDGHRSDRIVGIARLVLGRHAPAWRDSWRDIQMLRRFLAAVAITLTLIAIVGIPVAARSHGGTRHLPARIELPDGWQPEGIDSHGRTFWSGSLADGAIWRGDLKTGRGRVVFPGVAGKAAAGVDYDPRSGHLWVAGATSPEVRVYAGRRGDLTLLRTYTFPGAGFLNDVVVTRKAVYVTDSNVQQLIVIPTGRFGRLAPQSAAFTLPLTGDIQYVANQFNANGITDVRGWLIIVQSTTGQLFRVHPRTGEATLIDTGAFEATFGDGIEVRGNKLFVVRNQANLVAVLRLGRRLDSARWLKDITSPGLDVPTTATFGLGALWVVNARFGTPPTPTTEYWLSRLTRPLRSVGGHH